MNNRQLYDWVRHVSKQWTGVTRYFRENVAVFSRGVARAGSSQVRGIAGCAGGQPTPTIGALFGTQSRVSGFLWRLDGECGESVGTTSGGVGGG